MNALLAAALASFAWLPMAYAADATLTVRRIEVDDLKAVIGTVQTVQELPARARSGGTVTRLVAKEGMRVAAGDRLATVIDAKLVPQLQALDARISAQQAQRDQATLDFQRADELRRSGSGTQTRLEGAKTRLDVAERTVRALRAERDVVGQQSAEGAVLAPGAGRVLKVPVAEGSVVLPGEAIALLATDAYILRLQLPERHARTLAAGDTILVGDRGLDAPGAPTRAGKVQLVYPQIDQGRVIADVAVPGLGDYFVGERVRVQISTGKRTAYVVPAKYVFRRFGVTYVRFADGLETPVQVGPPAADGIELLSGVRDGDVLAQP